jgi:hypothetical protein
MKTFLPILVLLAGCAAAPRSEFRGLPFHAFERQLYVAHAGIPHLTSSEWESIRQSFQQRVGVDFDFRYALRLESGLVRVDLARRKNPENEGLSLFFEKKDDRWIENTAMAQEILFLAHFHG